MTSPSQTTAARAWVERNKAEGRQRISVWIGPPALDVLEKLAHLEGSYAGAIVRALMRYPVIGEIKPVQADQLPKAPVIAPTPIKAATGREIRPSDFPRVGVQIGPAPVKPGSRLKVRK